MLSVECIESIGLLSVWMLEPRLPELLLELRNRGYATARVRPKSLGGYDIMFIEPGVVAIKGSTYMLYNPSRRSITVESSKVDELLHVFSEVEEVLKFVGSDPAKGVLFYELQVKARASGGKWVLKKTIETSDLLGQDLLALPTSFVSAKEDPNSIQWLRLDIRPLWTSWSDERTRYEVILVYRDSKERLIDTLRNIDNILRDVLKRISDALEALA
ncbi:conserved hypothetical protein [Ignisphaera aggregans DSM 17230]|uniref:Uncharacterized protein n=1 Tax=Ignisphaera aggregans (strain DSM 17230 / JCM 13409 / AQ1.S1) TaxID=583356 RepID=E0ST99_IGNAA|nr:conserved hypothetical protein [Ignisphaera aggregans DSM 17230]